MQDVRRLHPEPFQAALAREVDALFSKLLSRKIVEDVLLQLVWIVHDRAGPCHGHAQQRRCHGGRLHGAALRYVSSVAAVARMTAVTSRNQPAAFHSLT